MSKFNKNSNNYIITYASWGSMIKEHYNYIVFDAAYLAVIPGVCIMLLVMSFNFLGNALRDALDVKLK